MPASPATQTGKTFTGSGVLGSYGNQEYSESEKDSSTTDENRPITDREYEKEEAAKAFKQKQYEMIFNGHREYEKEEAAKAFEQKQYEMMLKEYHKYENEEDSQEFEELRQKIVDYYSKHKFHGTEVNSDTVGSNNSTGLYYNEYESTDYWKYDGKTDADLENKLDMCYQSILDGDYTRNALGLLNSMQTNLDQYEQLKATNLEMLEGNGADLNFAIYEMTGKMQMELYQYIEESTNPAMECVSDLQVCLMKRKGLQDAITKKEEELALHLAKEQSCRTKEIQHSAEYDENGVCISKGWTEEIATPLRYMGWKSELDALENELKQLNEELNSLNNEALKYMEQINNYEQKNIEFKKTFD